MKSLRAAHAFFLAHLVNIVRDVNGLTEGADEFDYFIAVPLADFHVLGQRIADLEYTVKERFGIAVTALPIPVSP